MDKLPASDIKVEGKVFKWLDNYWYHYKWPTLIAAFFLVAFLVMGLQMCSSEKTDVYIIYAGPYGFEGSAAADFASEVNTVANAGRDKKLSCDTVDFYILSEEQINAEKAAAEEKGEVYYYNSQFFAEEKRKFEQLILAGEYSICLLDPAIYENVKESGGFRALSEVFETIPDAAFDEYGIRLADTGFARYFTNASGLPEDTVLCLRRESTMSFLNRSRAEEQYALYVEVFKKIAEFKIPE